MHKSGRICFYFGSNVNPVRERSNQTQYTLLYYRLIRLHCTRTLKQQCCTSCEMGVSGSSKGSPSMYKGEHN